MRKSVAATVVKHGLRRSLNDSIAWLTLDRPQADNRLSLELAQALGDAAAEIELDDRVVVVVLAAEGPNFCLGLEEPTGWEARVHCIQAIASMTPPVIAALQGDAFAEGFELALACDLRVASDRCHMAMPQITEGRLPRFGGTQRLPRLVGRMRALDLLLTGRCIDAHEAESMGLVSRVARHSDFKRELAAVVDALRGKGPLALRYAKEAVLKGADMTLEQGIRLEQDLYVLLQTTRDRREGVEAFLEKRKPIFRGR